MGNDDNNDFVTAEVIPLFYDELRRIAQNKVSLEKSDSLSATALVHEVFLRMMQSKCHSWNSKGHFFAAAALAMRRILVDQARRRSSLSRGREFARVEADVSKFADVDQDRHDTMVLKLDSVLDEFAILHPQEAELVNLRFFAGLSATDAARLMELPPRTARRRLAFARAKLQQLMEKME